jgi:hypothetical protein
VHGAGHDTRRGEAGNPRAERSNAPPERESEQNGRVVDGLDDAQSLPGTRVVGRLGMFRDADRRLESRRDGAAVGRDVRNLAPRKPDLHGQVCEQGEEEGECEGVHRGFEGRAELSLC